MNKVAKSGLITKDRWLQFQRVRWFPYPYSCVCHRCVPVAAGVGSSLKCDAVLREIVQLFSSSSNADVFHLQSHWSLTALFVLSHKQNSAYPQEALSESLTCILSWIAPLQGTLFCGVLEGCIVAVGRFTYLYVHWWEYNNTPISNRHELHVAWAHCSQIADGRSVRYQAYTRHNDRTKVLSYLNLSH